MIGPAAAEQLLGALSLTLDKLYELAKEGAALKPQALPASARFTMTIDQRTETTQNVVGVLEGADPKLKHEYVGFSAHYDHLKTGANGEIYHGADDDGSGTSAVLEIAESMSLRRPKRSIFVIFHVGEELGLLGAKYNADVKPAVPLEQLVVDLNIDMIGRSRPANDTNKDNEVLSGPNTVYVVGSDRISRQLHQLSEETNAQSARLNFDYTYNDPNHPERIYFRSDHWEYAKHGVPIIFYFTGVHADYHQPTDTIEKLDFEKMTKVARLVYETGWRIANLPNRLETAAASGK
jgi:Zn-dependent M28 family amino/carboxypeptidase